MPHYVQNVHVVLGKCQICDSRHLFAVAFWTHLNHQKCDKTLAPHSYDGVRHLPPNLGQSNDTSAQVARCLVQWWRCMPGIWSMWCAPPHYLGLVLML